MKVFIAGISGFLGSRLAESLSGDQEIMGCWNQMEPDLSAEMVSLDLGQDPRGLQDLLEGMRPDAVVNAAAISQPQACAKNPLACHHVNVEAALQMAIWCRRRNRPLIAFSSDTVYADATQVPAPNGGWTEESVLQPHNSYGKSKEEMEREVLRQFPEATLLRLSLLWGRAPAGRNSFSEWLLARHSEGQVPVFSDNYRHTMSMGALLALLRVMLDRPPLGLMNVGGPDFLNREQFAQALFQHLDMDLNTLQPGITADAKLAEPIPLELPLCLDRLNAWSHANPISLRDALANEYPT
jgi:dTDP-4-dehydrorhamnose reductase